MFLLFPLHRLFLLFRLHPACPRAVAGAMAQAPEAREGGLFLLPPKRAKSSPSSGPWPIHPRAYRGTSLSV
jgi:hypothetical protein